MRACALALFPTILGAVAEARPPTADLENRLGQQVSLDLSFVDHDGHEVLLSSMAQGKPLLLAPAYYRCHVVCSRLIEGLARAVSALESRYGWKEGSNYEIVTIGIDPRESPSDAMKKRQAVRATWPFLVGKEEPIASLANDLGFRFEYDPEGDQYAHPLALYVLTPSGVLSRAFFGVDFSPADLRLALLEASQGRTTTLWEKVLLSCYRYDPASRRYGLYVVSILRSGSVLILLGTGTLLATLWVRDRRRKQRA